MYCLLSMTFVVLTLAPFVFEFQLPERAAEDVVIRGVGRTSGWDANREHFILVNVIMLSNE